MSSKVTSCRCSANLSGGYLIIRIILFLIGTGLGVFDTVTDWQLVIRFKENGFNHPLLPLDVNWLRALYLFASIGTFFAVVTLVNESLDLLYNILKAGKKGPCCRTSGSHDVTKANGQIHANAEHNNVHFLMKERTTYANSESAWEKQVKEELKVKDDDGVEINDACKCCYRCGWNFTTRAETIAKFSLWFQDVPMLTLAVLYAYSQSTCKLPEVRDVTGDLFSVGLSAVASTFAVTFRVSRSILRVCVSVGLRTKSKREASEMMGNCGKYCSRLLPEKGDAIYPQDTCAQCCIIPFFISLLFDLLLVFMGVIISMVIWINYSLLKQTPNFDDSLAIFRFTYDGRNVPLLNISNNIIPASNGTFISFETVLDDNEVTHCLSEFVYREKDFKIFFNTIEVQAVSDKGVFCATKFGEDVSNFDTYSRCTIYYTFRGFVLFYGSTNRFTGKITRFDDECIVLKDRRPIVFAGPDPDRSIQVEKTINRTRLPKSPKDLFILYVSRTNETFRLLFAVSVADIVAGNLDKTYMRTFQDPSTEANLTYLIRFNYNYKIAQFSYNVKEVLNYPPTASQNCSCTRLSVRKFINIQTGLLVYGYYNPNTGLYPLLFECSEMPLDRIIPRYDPSIIVTCTLCKVLSLLG